MKILITDDVDPLLIEGFKKRSYIVDYQPNISLTETRQILHRYDGLVVNTKIKVDQNLIKDTKTLKCVARLGSGMDTIDTQLLEEKGIFYFNTPEANSSAVAEHCIGLILSLIRNISKAQSQMKQMLWKREENRGLEISNMKIGLIGFGHTGSKTAKLLAAFGAKLLVYDPYVRIETEIWMKLTQIESLEGLFDCDLISLHVNLNSETRHLINETFIHSMHKPFYLVNTSRGPVVHTMDLYQALKSGKLIGAALDVFENEKPGSYTPEEEDLYRALFALPNVVLTPHIAGWTFESKKKIAQTVLDKWPK
ncbi:MAG: phosphoglycerate dehydrogenase [Saprospiraceae bacterium]|nr:phosphoglycerate dehydrogenase [Saprospiraceae bacterium]